MKKILVIITTSFVPYGGLTTVAINYYRHMDKSKIRMDFCSTNEISTILQSELDEGGSTYYKLPVRKNILLYVWTLKKICKNYDAVHIHGNSSTITGELFAAEMAGVKKRIVHIHNTTCKHKIANKILAPIFNDLYTEAIACSKKAGEWIFNKKFYVLCNAVDLDKCKFDVYARQVIRKKYGVENSIVIGHVGKFNEQKNQIFLIRVFSEILATKGNAILLLVGDGILKKQATELVNKMGIASKVIFTGMLSNAKEYYSAFDCFVMPSLWEGLPLSAVEAQASGLRCVFSKNITREADLTKENKYLGLDEDLTAWSKEILDCVSYEDRQQKSDKYCRYLSEQGYDVCRNASLLMKIYYT